MSISIIDEFIKPKSHKRFINYRCDVCGYVGELDKSHYKDGVGCSVCAGATVLVGFNDIGTTNPECVKYLKNKEDAYKYTSGSGKHIYTECPVCGCQRRYRIADLCKRGFRCPVCYGGYSYPNRFMGAILQFFCITYENEKTFWWSKRYRYDFHVPEHSLIIEMNGGQHYKKSGFSKRNSLECILEWDAEKRVLAKDNGIKNYLEIKADRSDANYLFEQINKSGLLDILSIELTRENMGEIVKLADRNKFEECYELWNTGLYSTKEIAEVMHIDRSTVVSKLKFADSIGLCSYDAKKQQLIGSMYAREARKRPIMCITTGEQYNSIREAAEALGIPEKVIQNCVSGRSKSTNPGNNTLYKRLFWEYCDKE